MAEIQYRYGPRTAYYFARGERRFNFGIMATREELHALESLITRFRAGAAATTEAICVGDVVQLLPGAETHWESSLVLVEQLDQGKVRGTILRPHRGGCREAWYTFTPPEVARVGGTLYPPPCRAIRDQSYLAWCPHCMGRK